MAARVRGLAPQTARAPAVAHHRRVQQLQYSWRPQCHAPTARPFRDAGYRVSMAEQRLRWQASTAPHTDERRFRRAGKGAHRQGAHRQGARRQGCAMLRKLANQPSRVLQLRLASARRVLASMLAAAMNPSPPLL